MRPRLHHSCHFGQPLNLLQGTRRLLHRVWCHQLNWLRKPAKVLTDSPSDLWRPGSRTVTADTGSRATAIRIQPTDGRFNVLAAVPAA